MKHILQICIMAYRKYSDGQRKYLAGTNLMVKNLTYKKYL